MIEKIYYLIVLPKMKKTIYFFGLVLAFLFFPACGNKDNDLDVCLVFPATKLKSPNPL